MDKEECVMYLNNNGKYVKVYTLDNLNDELQKLSDENKYLKNNWNELKEYLKIIDNSNYFTISQVIREVLREIEEIEKGK